MTVRFSVIVPVRNGAPLVGATLESLRAQTHDGWEAVVVDDGSTDDTAAVVTEVGQLDDRIRLVSQPGAGVSAARNNGLRAARFEWVLFLDADDLLPPRFLEKVAATIAAHPRADAANTGWVRLLPDGRLFDEVPAQAYDDLFETTARYCPFAIHTCIVKRSLVVEVGGFDEELRVCEDWDLWGRLARMGLRLVPVWDAVAIYRVRGGSATFDGTRTIRDGTRVLDRLHGPDDRVPRPQPQYASGAPRDRMATSLVDLAVWAAGLVIGREADATGILDLLPDTKTPALDPASMASNFFESEQVGAGGRPLWARWPRCSKLCRPFFDRLEEITGASGLAARVELRLARLASDECHASAQVTLGSLVTQPLVVDQPLRDLEVGAEIERVRFRVEVDGSLAGHAEATVGDGTLPAQVVEEVVVRQTGEAILEAALLPELRATRRHRTSASLVAFLLWGAEPDPLHSPFRPIPAPPEGPSRRIHGRAAVDLALPVGDLHVEGGSGVDHLVEVAVTLGGAPVATLLLRPRQGRITASQLRATALRTVPRQLAQVAVAVAVLGRPPAASAELRDRLRDAADAAPAKGTGRQQRTPKLRARVVDERWLSWQSVVPDARQRVLATARRLPPRSRQRVKRLHSHVAAWGGPLAPLALGEGARGVPVLMYHRVSPTGNTTSRRWRITPEELDDQLRALRRAGYTGISLAELWAAWYEGARLPRRPVVLTFDDGFADFAEHAWPRLRTAGWGATVFVVTDAVGGRNTWDDVYDEQVPLMEWTTLRRLVSEGLDVGSHSVDHAALTALPPDGARRQVEASRERLEAEVGVAPRSFAYPFGDVDDAVVAIVAAAGYDFGVTCMPGSVTGRAEPLLLPRFEVMGATSGRSLVGELVRLRG